MILRKGEEPETNNILGKENDFVFCIIRITFFYPL